MYFSKKTLASLLLSLALSEVSAQRTGPRFNNSTRSATGPRVDGGRVEVTSSAGAATTSRAGAGARVVVGAPRGGAGASAGSGQQLPPVATGGAGADGLSPLPGDDNLAANPLAGALEPLPTIAPSPTLPTTLVRVTRSATTTAPVLSASQPLAPIAPSASSAAQSLSQTGDIAAPDVVIPSATSSLQSLPQLGADFTAPGLAATTSQPIPSVAAGIIIVSSIPGVPSSSQTSEGLIATTASGTGEVPLASATTSSDGILPIASATEATSTDTLTTSESVATDATATDVTATGATATNATITAEASTTAETASTTAETSATGASTTAEAAATDAAALLPLPAASDATGLIPIPVATDAPFPLTNATGVASLRPIGTGAAPQPTESTEAAPETSLLPPPATGPFSNSTRPINGTAPAAGRNSTSPLVPGAGSDGPADEGTLQPLPGTNSPSGSGDAESPSSSGDANSPSKSGSPAGPAGGNPTSGTNPSGGEDPLASLPNATGGQGGGSQTGTLRGLPTGTGGPAPTGTVQGPPSGTTFATSFTRPTPSVPASLTTVVTSGGQTMTLTVPNAAAITAGGTIVTGAPKAPGGDPNAASGLAASDALAGGVAAVVAVFLMV
ncbi:hypothetical protein GGTG_13967 [Gaeumannomyces tritici R3-111a-1]|uniref:Uncharacterized protein n=1 Tax=Gaeumannomyces tritici (strain R3-111a-1) TaxID=644352 RepID=J3PKB7_GAET3|nr:hypothetical protein GGTG_13967 [Gaeumannomyces tritici R3-111a-1]EJT68457.1 hypothetical protein GGTG_13967 [Gaeumannomyces tritici R3-111a-1]